MKASELITLSEFIASLRYDNIIQDEEGKLFRVSGVDTINSKVMTSTIDTWYNGDIFNPIPLTKEWLEKFGFDKDAYRFDPPRTIQISNESFCWNGHWLSMQPLKYVHQLQNLYFALTGQELI